MNLIIKPTELCQFKCDFCSSVDISDDKAKSLPHEYIFRFLKRFPNTTDIIINGGDPLMVPPDYYWKMIKYLDDNDMKTTISLTSNLWDFYIRPEKWIDLFLHKRIGVATSFQYGDGRKISKGRVLTEDIFVDIVTKFKDRVGYMPSFIAVIDENNEHTVMKTVRLAKKLGTVCKINFPCASGRQTKPYPKSYLYRHYINIHKAGLAEYESNTMDMTSKLHGRDTTCPLARNCDQHIRALNPDGSYFSCGSFADDRLFDINFDKEMEGELATPLSNRVSLEYLKEECISCPMFQICNGCKKHIWDLKQHKMVEEHCSVMKGIAPDILEIAYGRKEEKDSNDSPATRGPEGIRTKQGYEENKQRA